MELLTIHMAVVIMDIIALFLLASALDGMNKQMKKIMLLKEMN